MQLQSPEPPKPWIVGQLLDQHLLGAWSVVAENLWKRNVTDKMEAFLAGPAHPPAEELASDPASTSLIHPVNITNGGQEIFFK